MAEFSIQKLYNIKADKTSKANRTISKTEVPILLYKLFTENKIPLYRLPGSWNLLDLENMFYNRVTTFG